MVAHLFLNPVWVGVELVYSLIILVLCFLVFYKTKEMYDLTKHKGIRFFRYAFMFFGLAYAFRLLLFFIIIVNTTVCDFCSHTKILIPVSHFIVAYFSTMAIMYLVYSTIWKKISLKHFLTFSNIVALLIAFIAFVFRSPIMLSLIQFLLLVCSSVIITKNNKINKRINTKILYYLIFVFWLLSLIILQLRRLLPFEIKVIFQIMSIGVFVVIYHKVTKWAK